jgi:hypothetical protein
VTLIIGRCSGLRPAPRSPQRQGGQIVIRGTIMGTSTDDLKARRHQLLGLPNDVDDPIVPVVWSSDSTLDGFYRVISTSVEQIGPVASTRASFSATLQPISGNTAPLIETDVSAVVRTNSVGVTAAEPTVVALAYHQSASTYESVGVLRTRTGEDGGVYYGALATPISDVYAAFPSIANRYAGTCEIEMQYGATWYPIIGQQVPSGATGNWRISNSLVRFTYSTYTGTSTTVGGLTVEVWDSGAWRSTIVAKLGTWTGAAFSDADWPGDGIGSTQDPTGAIVACPLRILRNSPETVTIGFYKRHGATQFLSLNQGAMFCTLTTRAPASAQPMIRPVAAETASGLGATAPFSYDPGVQRSTNDANGNRYCLLYVGSGSWSLQDGGIRHGGSVSANTPITFGIGVVLDGSSAATGNTGLELGQQYVGQAAWRQQVVVR